MLDVHFHKEIEVAVSLLEGLPESDLKVLVPINICNLMIKSGDSSVVLLLQKSKNFQTTSFEEACLEKMTAQEKGRCVGRQAIIQRWLDKYRDSRYRSLMSLIPLMYTTTMRKNLICL